MYQRLILLSTLALSLVTAATQAQQTFLRVYGSQSSWGQRAIPTFDGGYISCGQTWFATAGDFDVTITRTDSLGNLIWQKDYHGDSLEYSWGIIANDDSTYTFLTTGYGLIYGDYNEVSITNIDDAGGINWSKTYTTGGRIAINSIVHTYDGGYMIGGWSDQQAQFVNPYLMKTNATGDTMWTRNYERGTQGQFNYVVQTQDSGYLGIGAVARPVSWDNDIAIIRTNKNGDTVWTKYYGDLNDQGAMKCYQESDGSVVLVGGSYNGTDFEALIWKINALGDTVWTSKEAVPGQQLQYTGVCKTYDGGYYATGEQANLSISKSICLAAHFDSNGNRTWGQTWDVVPPIQGPGDLYSKLIGLEGTPDGGGIACGWATNGDDVELILLKLYGNWSVGMKGNPSLVAITPYPNPFSAYSNFLIPPSMGAYSFTLSSLSGQVLMQENGISRRTYQLNKDNLPPGIYLFKIEGENGRMAVGKIAVQ